MRWRWLCAVLACLVVAGCADGDKRPSDDKFGGFYGGVTGGTDGP
jgi:hypothetical protein